jgi:hypothetical protein
VGGIMVVIIIAAVISTQIFKSLERKVNFTDAQVRQILKTDLPLGTAKSVVKHFLDAKGWGYSDAGPRKIRFQRKLISYELEDFYKGP